MRMYEFRLKKSLKFVPMGSINNMMDWHWQCNNTLSKAKLVCLLTHICATRPQWVVILHIRMRHIIYFSLAKWLAESLDKQIFILHPRDPHLFQSRLARSIFRIWKRCIFFMLVWSILVHIFFFLQYSKRYLPIENHVLIYGDIIRIFMWFNDPSHTLHPRTERGPFFARFIKMTLLIAHIRPFKWPTRCIDQRAGGP